MRGVRTRLRRLYTTIDFAVPGSRTRMGAPQQTGHDGFRRQVSRCMAPPAVSSTRIGWPAYAGGSYPVTYRSTSSTSNEPNIAETGGMHREADGRSYTTRTAVASCAAAEPNVTHATHALVPG